MLSVTTACSLCIRGGSWLAPEAGPEATPHARPSSLEQPHEGTMQCHDQPDHRLQQRARGQDLLDQHIHLLGPPVADDRHGNAEHNGRVRDS